MDAKNVGLGACIPSQKRYNGSMDDKNRPEREWDDFDDVSCEEYYPDDLSSEDDE